MLGVSHEGDGGARVEPEEVPVKRLNCQTQRVLGLGFRVSGLGLRV